MFNVDTPALRPSSPPAVSVSPLVACRQQDGDVPEMYGLPPAACTLEPEIVFSREASECSTSSGSPGAELCLAADRQKAGSSGGSRCSTGTSCFFG